MDASLPRRLFRQELDRFVEDVRQRALASFDRGMPPGRAIRFAVETAAGLAALRAQLALERAQIDARQKRSS